MKLATILLAVALAVVLSPGAATACSCNFGPPELYYLENSHIFLGTPLSVEIVDSGGGLLEFHYQMDVLACWKGDFSQPQFLVTLVEEAACGIELFVGEEYLIYGGGNAARLSSGLCNVFGAASTIAQTHLDYLGPPDCPLPVEPDTWGRIKATYR